MRKIAATTLFFALAACTPGNKPPLSNKTSDGRLAPRLQNLGALNRTITTSSPDAQKYFNQGLTLVYAFNHAEAVRSFKEASRLDDAAPMPYWGLALALAPNINDPAIGPDREKQGADAMKYALERQAKGTAMEQALIGALSQRFDNSEKPDRAALNRAYAEAMKKVYASFPDDPDVASLYADSLMNTMPWDYWDKQGNPKPGIAAIRAALEKNMQQHANHHGLNHLYIHLMEATPEVDLAVPAADRLGGLAPAAGHLVHMPAHIYIRVGRYADAAKVNVDAVKADEDYITQCRAQGIYPAAYYPHNIHFLNAVLAMDGRSREAMESARKMEAHHDHAVMQEPGFGFAHLLKTIPFLTMVRFGRWDEILKEAEPPVDQPFGRAMRHFARGYALSVHGKQAEAQQELAALRKAASNPELEKLKIMEANSLAELSRIGVAMLEGEIARRTGKHNTAIASFKKAVALEEDLKYSEPPDWMLPPNQYLGEALMAAGKFADAEKIYRADLNRHRNNGWSLTGLEQALRRQGKAAEADKTKASFDQTWVRADVKLAASRF